MGRSRLYLDFTSSIYIFVFYPSQSSNSILPHSSMQALAYNCAYALMDLRSRSQGHSNHRKVLQNGSIHRSRYFHNTAISSFHHIFDIALLPNHDYYNMSIPIYIQRLDLPQPHIPDKALVFQQELVPDMAGIQFE